MSASATVAARRVGFLDPGVLYADLRERLTAEVELVDLSGAGSVALVEGVRDLDVVLHHPRVPLTADVVAAGNRLRAVFAPGAGYDGIPIAAATEVGVLVTNQAGCNAEAVAEHSIGLLLAVSKRIAEGDRQIRSPRGWRTAMFLNHEIRGLTLGLVGFGAIARRLADIAGHGFGMPVLAFDPYVVGAVDGVELCDLDDLLRRSDVVSVHVPLTDETHGLLGAQQLALLRPTAILLNTARGHIVDLDALTVALARGELAGAGLDVFDDDLLLHDDPLLALPNVVVTPHIAGATFESLESQAVRQASAVREVLDGRVPTSANVLNPAVVERFLQRFGTKVAGR
jgi:D-3-phosphoglycerate dehydrogenase